MECCFEPFDIKIKLVVIDSKKFWFIGKSMLACRNRDQRCSTNGPDCLSYSRFFSWGFFPSLALPCHQFWKLWHRVFIHRFCETLEIACTPAFPSSITLRVIVFDIKRLLCCRSCAFSMNVREIVTKLSVFSHVAMVVGRHCLCQEGRCSRRFDRNCWWWRSFDSFASNGWHDPATPPIGTGKARTALFWMPVAHKRLRQLKLRIH